MQRVQKLDRAAIVPTYFRLAQAAPHRRVVRQIRRRQILRRDASVRQRGRSELLQTAVVGARVFRQHVVQPVKHHSHIFNVVVRAMLRDVLFFTR